MPDSVSEERRKLVKQYGADIRVVHDEGDIGKCINDCIQMAMDMKAKDPRVFVPQPEPAGQSAESVRGDSGNLRSEYL